MGFEAPQGLIGQIDETIAITDLSDVTAITGTGTTVVFSASPTFTGTVNGAAVILTGNLDLDADASLLRLGASQDVILARDAAAGLQLGSDVNGAAVAQTFKAHDGITGTDIAGANLTLAGGRGTGAGAVGNLLLATSTLLASGTTAQTLTTRVTITGTNITSTLPLLFTDNAVDIGASGATRPRTGYFGTSIVCPLFTITGANDLTLRAPSGRAVVIDVAATAKISVAASTVTLADALDFVFNATTGTKIGTATTQKISVYNATPVVQGAAVADASGGAVIDAEARTALNALLARIRTFGIIAT